jgi:hypothetical protein
VKRIAWRWSARCALWAALLAVAGGCALSHKVAVNGSGAPQYERVDISYRIPGTHGPLARRAHNETGVIGAAGERESPSAATSAGTLTIEYPHPQGDPAMARATLRLSQQSTSRSKSLVGAWRSHLSWLPGATVAREVTPAAADEVWVLDFPRQQLDLMLFDLANSGFFDDQSRHEGSAHLSVTIDRGRASKTWSPEARLDDVVLRVQREGWLASSPQRPADRMAR